MYFDRIIEKEIKDKLDCIGAVLIEGPKWCGKTTTAEKFSKSEVKMKDPTTLDNNLLLADIKPSLLLKGDKPKLLDEWQVAPVLWDAVRTDVDNEGKFGQYILTGSNTVDSDQIHHSGTGRIDRITMLPMSLYESQDSNGKISLKELFDDKDLNIDGIKSDLSIEKLIYVASRGGWPISLEKKDEKEALEVAKNYCEEIYNTNFKELDGVKRDAKRMEILIKAYAKYISTITTNNDLIKEIEVNDKRIDVKTLKSYLSILEKLFIIDEVPAWCPDIKTSTAISSSNKREFIDPSLVVAALGLTPDELLLDLKTFGFIFETLCIRDLKVYSSALGGRISHYHDRANLEVNAVLHLEDGRYALIEMKLGSKQIDDGAEHLLEIKELIKKRNENNSIKMREPDLCIILTGGNMAYTRKDGVKVIPIGCLKN